MVCAVEKEQGKPEQESKQGVPACLARPSYVYVGEGDECGREEGDVGCEHVAGDKKDDRDKQRPDRSGKQPV